MAILQEYHRPRTEEEAVALLAESAGRLVPLAGGTLLVGQLETRTVTGIDGVVDLRDAVPGEIVETDGAVHIGAMCTLFNLTAHPRLGSLANGLLRRAARGEGPLNLRNAATVGGAVACAEYDSEVYACLLALDTAVTVLAMDRSQQTVPLAEFESTGQLITSVSIPSHSQHGAAARVARTPSDRPIVAAYAAGHGNPPEPPRLALCGVAPRPVLAETPLNPPDDFKGSRAYRTAMSEILTQRAMTEMEKARRDAD